MTTTAAIEDPNDPVAFLAWATGTFERFAGMLDIVPKSGGRRKFQLNAIQKLFCIERTGRDIVLKPRQIGFTTLELARDVYTFLFTEGARVVVVCQSIVGDGPLNILSATCRIYFDSLRKLGIALDFVVEKAHEWQLPNGNTLRIVTAGASEASASKVGRSGTITRLHVTEQAFFEYADETMNALIECVPGPETGSEIVIESTPNGAEGMFYNQCKAAERKSSGYRFHFYPWFHVAEYATELDAGEVIEPRDEKEERLVARGVRPEQLKWRRQKIAGKGSSEKGGEDLFDQEYPSDPETCFLSSGRKFFDPQKMKAMLDVAIEQPLERRDHDRIRIWKAAEHGRTYLLSADPSEGGALDPSGAYLADEKTGEHVATIDGMYTPHELAEALDKLGREYNEAWIGVERNNHGHAVLLALDAIYHYPKIYSHDDKKLGWLTSLITRPIMLDGLDNAIRQDEWSSKDRQVLSQVKAFEVPKSGKPQAPSGQHDELVICAAINLEMRVRSYNRFIDDPGDLSATDIQSRYGLEGGSVY